MAITSISLILLLIFVVFLFLASQAKRNFEEQYIMSARTNYRLKTIERILARRRQ
jgi:protein-S-isoprenylcysteine O-methyltransferase Ste14